MKTVEEIKKAIEQIEKNYEEKAIPEFVRGQYNAFKWILGEEVSK